MISPHCIYKVSLVSLTALYLSACDTHDLRSFYYPFDKLARSPQVYVYSSVKPMTGEPYYVYMQVLTDNSRRYLVTQTYNAAFQPEQLGREQIVSNGTKMEALTLYNTDSTGRSLPTQVEIRQPAVFPFRARPDEVYIYEVMWSNSPGKRDSTTRIIRNRSFEGDTTWVFQSKRLDAVKIKLREEIENRSNGSLTLQYDGVEIYARSLGLVYSEKNVSENYSTAYILQDIMPMDSLVKKMAHSK